MQIEKIISSLKHNPFSMNKKLFFLLVSFFIGFISLSAQEIVFCYDVDEHDGKCKPMDSKTVWKMNGGEASFFALIKFAEEPKYPKLNINVYRNGDMSKPFYNDMITAYSPGDKCIRTNLIIRKRGSYTVTLTDDDDKVIGSGGNFSVE